MQTPEPVNELPDFVPHIVCRLKVLQPTLGKKRSAQILAGAGLHIGVTTVKRMLEWGRAEPPTDSDEQTPVETTDQARGAALKRTTKPGKSTRPDHVWQVDLIVVPTSAGFWVPWSPQALAQRWPFCW